MKTKNDAEKMKRRQYDDSIAKSHDSHASTIIKYCTSITVKQSQLEKDIMKNTIENHRMARMLGAPEVLQMGKNFIRLIKGSKCLDVGTFTGASAVAWAIAVPEDGKVYSFDISHEALDSIGKPLIEKYPNISKKISFIKGQALDSLDQLINNGESGTWDFAFIDADKTGYPNYYERIMKLLRPGGVILIDNSLMRGNVADTECNDEGPVAVRKLNKTISEDNNCDNMLLNVGDGIHVVFKH